MDQSTWIPWSPDCLQDLRWWLQLPRLSQGVSLRQVSPDLDFWSDASDVGWGAHLGHHTASGLWSHVEVPLSINAKELLAVRRDLLHFQSSLVGKTVSVFCDNSTSVAYLRKEGGTRSPFLNSLAQGILRWSECRSPSVWLPSLFRGPSMSWRTLSRPHQLPHTEWFLNQDVFRSLRRLWPVQIDLFATSENRKMLDIFLSLPRSPCGRHGRLPPVLGQSTGLPLSSVVSHSQGSSEAKGILRNRAHSGGSVLAPEAMVSGPPPSVAGTSSGSSGAPRPIAPATVSAALPGSPQASPSCLETLRHFTRGAGFSSTVASQASLARRPSSCKVYQLKWQVYRSWCLSHGHSVSRPSLAKVTDFLCWLRSSKALCVSSIKGYRSMLSAVFRFHLPSLSSHPVIRDLLRSFCLTSAERQLRPPSWDLSGVLRYLNSSEFEPRLVLLCAL